MKRALTAAHPAGQPVPWRYLQSIIGRRYGIRPDLVRENDAWVREELVIMRIEREAEGRRG